MQPRPGLAGSIVFDLAKLSVAANAEAERTADVEAAAAWRALVAAIVAAAWHADKLVKG